MLSHIFQPLIIALAFCAGIVSSQNVANSLVSRRLTEYLLPATRETHEFARVPNSNFVLLSQMSDSQLIKIELDPATEEPIAWQSFPMGKNSQSALHGVWPSTLYPGKVWLTLQGDNKLLLVDPGQNLSTVPSIIRTIDIPAPGNGPHCVFEIGNRVWAGLKVASPQTGHYYVFSADILNTTDQTLYQCLNSPVFIKEEPTTGLIYATQDTDSSIMRINVTSGETAQLPIPPNIGSTPVGMITAYGPMNGVWFSLAGNATGGAGSFGHIGSNGELQFFQLKNPQLGANAGLLHLADASSVAGGPALWLLSTSLLSTNSPDALVRVTLDDSVTSIAGEEYISMLTQNAMVHRVVPMDATVLVSELNTFTLAQLTYNNTIAGQWLPSEIISDTTVYTEAG
jgi:virginiamycin B lyase